MRINISPIAFGPESATQFSAENHRLLRGNVASLISYWSAAGRQLYRADAQLTTEQYLAWCETDAASDDDHWLTLAHAARLGLEVQGQPAPTPTRWEVLRDTLVSRVMGYVGRETTLAILASMSDAQRLEFLAFDRFWSDNDEIRAFIASIPYTYEQDDGEGNVTQVQGHLDPEVILARDPRL